MENLKGYHNPLALVNKQDYEEVLDDFNLKKYSISEQIGHHRYWVKVQIHKNGNNYLKVKKAIKTIERRRGCGVDVRYFLNTRECCVVDGKIKMCYNGKNRRQHN